MEAGGCGRILKDEGGSKSGLGCEEIIQHDRLYPNYCFAQHKGYSTPEHLQRLYRYGVSPIHRRSFAPVAELLGIELNPRKYGQVALIGHE